MAQLRFQPIFFIQNFVIFSIKSMKFLAYALGHILFAVTILSILTQSELLFRTIIDGSFLQLLLYVSLFVVIVGMGSGFIAAAYNVLRTQLLAAHVTLNYQPERTNSRK